MRLAALAVPNRPGVDPAIVAAADRAMTFDFDAEKLIDLAVESRFSARDAVELITVSDEIATLDDSTYAVARMGFGAARSEGVGDVVGVMDAAGDAATMDDATIEAVDLGLRALSSRSASDVVRVIEQADRAGSADSDFLRALREQLGQG